MATKYRTVGAAIGTSTWPIDRREKLRTQKRSLFCIFKTGAGGMGGSLCRFSRSPGHFAFVFFYAAQAPLRVSQNDSSGQSVFLGQLVEEGTIYSQSSSRGSENAGTSAPQSGPSSLRKMRSCFAGAEAQCRPIDPANTSPSAKSSD